MDVTPLEPEIHAYGTYKSQFTDKVFNAALGQSLFF